MAFMVRSFILFAIAGVIVMLFFGARRGVVTFGSQATREGTACMNVCDGRAVVRAAIETDLTGAVRGFHCECAAP